MVCPTQDEVQKIILHVPHRKVKGKGKEKDKEKDKDKGSKEECTGAHRETARETESERRRDGERRESVGRRESEKSVKTGQKNCA